MINNDRIVPIQKIDYLTLIGTILNLTETAYAILAPKTVLGDFVVEGSGDVGAQFCNQPAKSIDFADGVTAGSVLFCASEAFEGFTIDGSAATIASDSNVALDEIKKDGVTLYGASLSSGEVSISAVTPIV